MKKRLLLVAACLLSLSKLSAQTNSAEQAISIASKQTQSMIEKIDETGSIKYPKTITDGKTKYIGGSDWTLGFFPGELWYLSQLDTESGYNWEEQAARFTDNISMTQYLTKHHDIGFMMMCSFGNGMRFYDRADYIPVVIQSANSLMCRYHPHVGVIQSWGNIAAPDGEKCEVIIDNMMNLELLFEATALTGDSTFYKAAVSHADVTMKNHFRKDYSSFHVVNYDLGQQKPTIFRTHQGWRDDSAWARGQAWGLYGYTMCYRYTKDPRYLEQAKNIAKLVIKESSKIKDKIYFWDYDVKKTDSTPRDASAAAIVASALYELEDYVPGMSYSKIADGLVESLSNSKYLAEVGTNKNFILKHSTGHLPKNIEVDVPLNYADYYYLEALYRQKMSHKGVKIGTIEKRTEPTNDRKVWLTALDKISRPVFENLAAGTLKANMPIENHRNSEVTHLEAVGRLMTGISPWLESESGNKEEVELRKEYRTLVIKGLTNCVDPKNADYIDFGVRSQNLVDAAFLVHGLLRCRSQIWDKLDKTTQQRLISSLEAASKFESHNNNWVLFSAMVEIGLKEFSGKWDESKVSHSINSMSEWYKGDGIYGDGKNLHADYYNSFVIHPMLTFIVEYMDSIGKSTTIDLTTQVHRMQRYAAIMERLISPEGTYPVIGRSICYRFGAFYALSDAAYRQILPYTLQPAQVRSALTAVIKRQATMDNFKSEGGWLKLGFNGSQVSLGEGYISTGSLYLSAAVFPALGLPTNDRFWSDPYTEWTTLKAWGGKYVNIDHAE